MVKCTYWKPIVQQLGEHETRNKIQLSKNIMECTVLSYWVVVSYISLKKQTSYQK